MGKRGRKRASELGKEIVSKVANKGVIKQERR